MKTALLLIATGSSYWQYVEPLLVSADKFFVPHVPMLFTDSPKQYKACQFYHEAEGFPNTTLKRYHTFLTQKKLLLEFDYVFYLDIDAIFVSSVGSEIFGDGIIATLHHNQRKEVLLEDNPRSTAYSDKVKQYYCGGFNGGTTKEFLKMASVLIDHINQDEANGVLARWHDESHLNKYLADNPPAKVLPSTYCYPEPELYLNAHKPKIVCLDKSLRGGR